MPDLRRLDVSDNNFKGKAGEVLVQALKNKVRFLYSGSLHKPQFSDIVRLFRSNFHVTIVLYKNLIVRLQTQLEYLNLRDDALEGVSASPEQLSLFNALVEAANAGSSLKHVDLSGARFVPFVFIVTSH